MAQQGPQPEWQGLINQLVNLNSKQADIQAVATSAAETIQTQSQALIAVSTELEKILTKLKDTPSSAQIKAALEKANGDQKIALTALIQAQNDALTPQINTLQTNVKAVQSATKLITETQTPPPPAVGGKRRRRTRSKGKKYHKRTKRGGYPYGNGKGKGKGKDKTSPKKK